MVKPVTILDVLDNFLSVSTVKDFARMSGARLRDLGLEVQRFAASYEPASAVTERVPLYLGGWPSANFFHASQGKLIMSSLLYAGQVYAKDPLLDWFSDAQYHNEHVVSARQGYRDGRGMLDIEGTRRFLSTVVPGVMAMRPLIEAGILVLVPGESLFAKATDEISRLRAALLSQVGADPERTAAQFHPDDVPVDDRRRGLFTFAGGDRELQLRSAIDLSLLYFAREWLLAQSVGAEYTAVWPYEQHLCEAGLGALLRDSPHQRVVSAVLHSRLPVFQGLTPKVIADVHDAEPFAEFRTKLFEVYRQVPNLGPGAKYDHDLAQLEETLLRPTLQRAEREASQGWLARAGASATEFVVSVGARLGVDAVSGGLDWTDVGKEVVGEVADRVVRRGGRRPATVWTQLSRHHRSILDELAMTSQQAGNRPAEEPWYIGPEPSMSVTISPGIVLVDQVPIPSAPKADDDYREGPYRPCECGSGLKWKFCCRGVE